MNPEDSQPIHLHSAPQPERSGESRPGLVLILAVVLFFLFWVSILLIVPYRQFHFTPAWIFLHIQTRFRDFCQYAFGRGNEPFGITIYQYAAAVVAGAALAACGTSFQGSFRNQLAGPSTMGVMSGGTLGCLIYLLCFTSPEVPQSYATADLTAWANRSLWEVYARQLCVLAGSFGAVLLVVSIATAAGRGKVSAPAMILSGTVLSSIVTSVTSVLQYYMILTDPEDPRIDAFRDMLLGTLDGITSLRTLLLMAVPVLLCLGALLLLRGRLDLLSLDPEEAISMGIRVQGLRNLMILTGTVLTAVVTAFCGHIGFLGFMVPLVGRKLAGPSMRQLLPVSMLLGAILLVLVWDMAYILGMSGSLNLFTSCIGCVVMVAALIRRKEV